MKKHQKKSFLEYCAFHQIQPIHTINDDAVYKQCDICLKRVSFRNVDFHMKTKHLEY